MNKNSLLSLLSNYAVPVLTILCGLVLLFSPDSASVLVSKLLSVLLTLWAIGCVLAGIFGSGNRISPFLMAAAGTITARWLSRNPLGLAAGISRILGICLLVGALGSFFQSRTVTGKVLSAVEGILGLILILLPLFASRLIFTICGLVVTALGITMFANRFRQQRRLDGGKPDIIDAL